MISFKKLMPFLIALTITFPVLVNAPIASAETVTYPTYTADEYYSSAYSLYRSNPVAFDSKFKNKTIIVSGEIEKIEQSNSWNGSNYTVSLKGGIRCYFDGSQASAIANLSVGEQISVRGKAHANMVLNSFTACLAQCKINVAEINSQNPDFVITAQELQDAFRKNKLEAIDKYKDKTVLVSGVVFSTSKDMLNTPIINLKTMLPDDILPISTPNGSIRCYFTEDEISTIAKVRPGQRISIMGTVTDGIIYFVSLHNCIIK